MCRKIDSFHPSERLSAGIFGYILKISPWVAVAREVNAMLSNIGFPGLILILIIALVVFGPSKLPEIGRAVGRGLREFKDSVRDVTSTEDKQETPAVQQAQTLKDREV